MHTLLDDDEKIVKTTARQVLEKESPVSLVRGCWRGDERFAPSLWKHLTDLGWTTMCLDEANGGGGLPLSCAGLLAEEVGRHLSPVPLVPTLAAGWIVDQFASDEIRTMVSSRLGDGTAILTYAHAEGLAVFGAGAIGVTASREMDGLVLRGRKQFVDGLFASTHALVSCNLDGALALVLVDLNSPGIERVQAESTAGDDTGVLVLGDVRVPSESLVAEGEAGSRAVAMLVDCACALMSAQMAGAARRTLEMATEYVKNRWAFERPIGSFQAIQHMSADMLIAVDGAEMLAREALWFIGTRRTPRAEASQAKAFSNDRLVAVVRSAQQMHGGMGFMKEFDLHLWYRAVVAWSLRLGTSREHRARVTDRVLSHSGVIRLDSAFEG